MHPHNTQLLNEPSECETASSRAAQFVREFLTMTRTYSYFLTEFRRSEGGRTRFLALPRQAIPHSSTIMGAILSRGAEAAGRFSLIHHGWKSEPIYIFIRRVARGMLLGVSEYFDGCDISATHSARQERAAIRRSYSGWSKPAPTIAHRAARRFQRSSPSIRRSILRSAAATTPTNGSRLVDFTVQAGAPLARVARASMRPCSSGFHR